MRLLVLLSICVCFALSCENSAEPDIEYSISETTWNDQPAILVTLSYKPFEVNKTELLFQDKGWGQDSLHNVIGEVKVVEGASEIIQKRELDQFEIHHTEDTERVVVQYTLVQDTDGKLDTQKAIRPIINEDYFHVFSHNLFMLPKSVLERTEDDFSVSIDWIDFDEDYVLQNSFGGGNNQSIESISEAQFHSAVFVGGDFRISNIEVNNNSVVFATRGEWETFEDSKMVTILKNTVQAQRDFWQDHSQEYFLVTMIPTIQDKGYSFHGTGLTNSFATSVSNNESTELEGLVYLLNHELQHNWTGKVIQNENEEEQYWFSEGFTEYYGFKNIATNGIFGMDTGFFISKMNENIMNLYNSSVLSAPNSEINYDNFWSNAEYSKLPYYRGALFAFYLDLKLQKESKGENSLDDLMLQIKKDAVENESKLNHSYFIKTANRYLSEDIGPIFEKHIVQGIPMDLKEIYSNYNLEFKETSKVFDLGFRMDQELFEVRDLDKSSKAYLAGMREGDKIIGMSHQYDHSKEAEFVVTRDGTKHTFRYYPVKEAEIPSLLNSEANSAVLGL